MCEKLEEDLHLKEELLKENDKMNSWENSSRELWNSEDQLKI